MARGLNKAVLELVKEVNAQQMGIEVVPGCTVHPADGELPDEEGGSLKPEQVLEEAVKNGARVVKLHCSVGSYEVTDDRLWFVFVPLPLLCS